jgi:hypothetical protein
MLPQPPCLSLPHTPSLLRSSGGTLTCCMRISAYFLTVLTDDPDNQTVWRALPLINKQLESQSGSGAATANDDGADEDGCSGSDDDDDDDDGSDEDDEDEDEDDDEEEDEEKDEEEAVAPPPPAAALLDVVVPPGVSAGSTVEFTDADGAVMQAVVPEGLREGDTFQVSAEAPPSEHANGVDAATAGMGGMAIGDGRGGQQHEEEEQQQPRSPPKVDTKQLHSDLRNLVEALAEDEATVQGRR